jgi:hypothetical protein
MGRSPILPMGAAVAAVALAASPGLPAVRPSERREYHEAVAFPLLALAVRSGSPMISSHYSHYSHASHSSHYSHYSGSHNSHASHYSHNSHASHFSTSPYTPPPSPSPTPTFSTATPRPHSPTATPTTSAATSKHPKPAQHKSASPTSIPSPIVTISPRLTNGHATGNDDAGGEVAIAVVLLAGCTAIVIYGRRRRNRR